MSEIRLARLEDIPELKRIWYVVFGDEDWYTDGFFQNLFRPESAVVFDNNGALCGSAYLLELGDIISPGASPRPCAVTYALGVLPEHRGKGYGALLTSKCIALCKSRGLTPVICPAEASLFDYYALCSDYRNAFYCRSENVPACGGNVTELTPHEYSLRREKLLADRCHIAFSREMMAWQDTICRKSGGGFFAVGNSIAAVEAWDEIVAKEYLGDISAAGALAHYFGRDTILLRTPAGSGGTPFAMSADVFPGKPAWFGFAFD